MDKFNTSLTIIERILKRYNFEIDNIIDRTAIIIEYYGTDIEYKSRDDFESRDEFINHTDIQDDIIINKLVKAITEIENKNFKINILEYEFDSYDGDTPIPKLILEYSNGGL